MYYLRNKTFYLNCSQNPSISKIAQKVLSYLISSKRHFIAITQILSLSLLKKFFHIFCSITSLIVIALKVWISPSPKIWTIHRPPLRTFLYTKDCKVRKVISEVYTSFVLQCTVSRRMSKPEMGSIFHIKNRWNILVIGNYYVNYQNLMLLTFSDTKRTLMHIGLFTNSAQRELVSICTQSIHDRNKLSLPYILGYSEHIYIHIYA